MDWPDVIGFTMSALSGSWQAQFQKREAPVGIGDVWRGVIRTAVDLAEIVFPPLPSRASFAYDREQRVASLLTAYETWNRRYAERGVGILDRARQADATDEERFLAWAWWQHREKFWPKRDRAQLYRAARRALQSLNQPYDRNSCESLLLGVREHLVSEAALFRGCDGSLQLGRWNLRDIAARVCGYKRDRPKRRSAKQSTPPKIRLNEDPENFPYAGSDLLDAVTMTEFAEQFPVWAAQLRRRVKPTSAKGRILDFMQGHPGEPVPIRGLAREFDLDAGGVSRAAKALRKSWTEFLTRRSA